MTPSARAFGVHVRYGQIEKRYVGEPPIDAARRYSPGVVVGVHREGVFHATRNPQQLWQGQIANASSPLLPSRYQPERIRNGATAESLLS